MSAQIKIADKIIGEGQPVFLIAEAGVNHNGDLDTALCMIDLAKDAGADAVKFQSFCARDMILPDVEKAAYQTRNTGSPDSQSDMLASLEIDKKFHEALLKRCRERGIIFLSTPYDIKNLELLEELDVPAIKVSSTDANNVLFLKRIARTGKPVLLSTGMADRGEIVRAYELLRAEGCKDICLLKCTSNYPASKDEVNLAGIGKMSALCPDAVIGFSDHTQGEEVSALAVACGAKVIEKHFTLDKNMPGPDHRASMSPDEFRQWVRAVRESETIMGNAELEPAACELESRKLLRRYFVLARDMQKGEVIAEKDLVPKRTGGRGISAASPELLIGKTLCVSLGKNTPVKAHHLS